MKPSDTKKRRRLLRKLLLKKLIKNILEGKVVTVPEPEGELYNSQGQPRPNYHSPNERSGYNYGYMEIDEIGAGTPTIW